MGQTDLDYNLSSKWVLTALGLLPGEVICLDGGLATELESQGMRLSSRLWSAQLLIDDIEAIYRCHNAFLEAGARIITTASYQATLQGLTEQGLTRKHANKVLLDSVAVACKSRDLFFDHTKKMALVAASVGPYGAYLADGSEYQGNYGLSVATLVDFHKHKIEILDRSDADLLACETIPDYHEACALAEILRQTDIPAWVSFCCRNGQQLHDGTPIESAISLFNDNDKVFAVGVNCTAPEHISSLVCRIRVVAPRKMVVVYPNSGEIYLQGQWMGRRKTTNWQDECCQWVEKGVSILGGCCRIGSIEIFELARLINTLSIPRTQSHLHTNC